DFLRFMPEKTEKNRVRWHLGVILSGPGWIIMGAFKMLVGAVFAYLIARHGLGWEIANNPTQMYLLGYSYVFNDREWMMLATVLLVCISQIKINITNAYAGSLAWSNFFSRLTHSHPGRVVWTVFNALIAIMLMEMSIFRVLEQVLGLYSNIAISWIAAVVADLVINKPLGLSPRGIEFKRAYLYDINPVGVGAMLLASVLSTSAFLGLFGVEVHSFSAFIALGVAFVSAPVIALLTRGKYYVARTPDAFQNDGSGPLYCSICEKKYEREDMAFCKAYQGPICSLCCTLDARCNDLCKPASSRIEVQVSSFLRPLLPKPLWNMLEAGLGYYVFLMITIIGVLTGLLGMIFYHQYLIFTELSLWNEEIKSMFLKIYVALIFLSGIIVWWLVLTRQSRRVAQEESNRQTALLMQEIESHHQTDAQLQEAKRIADQASEAKSRYISSISHELRTPLNSILGYAQLLDVDQNIPPHRRQAVSVIRRSGDHLLSLIDTTLDIARIEGGHVKLDIRPVNFAEFIDQIVQMFTLQAQRKGLEFRFESFGDVPLGVRADKRRLGQVLINILANAIKFTDEGNVVLRLRYAREMAVFEVQDTGPGIPEEELTQIFEPFKRGNLGDGGTGLGLTVSKMLINLMGGELNVSSQPGQGATFQARLFLPEVRDFQPEEQPKTRRTGYFGSARRILIVDNEKDDREFLTRVLEPLGFHVRQAQSGTECLELLHKFTPDLILMEVVMPG
ncbi:MAG: response regulator, partial [Methylobacterium sp.]|nr:response regulator [Methylobacterium sp.]